MIVKETERCEYCNFDSDEIFEGGIRTTYYDFENHYDVLNILELLYKSKNLEDRIIYSDDSFPGECVSSNIISYEVLGEKANI